MVVARFFIIFFGIAAIIVGALVLAGLPGPAWTQWALFPVIALVALRLFRQRLLAYPDARKRRRGFPHR